ncbi:hypothetical protein ACLOJK_019086 [Asimina triloba]
MTAKTELTFNRYIIKFPKCTSNRPEIWICTTSSSTPVSSRSVPLESSPSSSARSPANSPSFDRAVACKERLPFRLSRPAGPQAADPSNRPLPTSDRICHQRPAARSQPVIIAAAPSRSSAQIQGRNPVVAHICRRQPASNQRRPPVQRPENPSAIGVHPALDPLQQSTSARVQICTVVYRPDPSAIGFADKTH